MSLPNIADKKYSKKPNSGKKWRTYYKTTSKAKFSYADFFLKHTIKSSEKLTITTFTVEIA